MKYKPHQIKASDEAWEILRKKGIVCLFGLPRTGKTRTALRLAGKTGVKSVLVLTRKAAIPGWKSEIDAVKPDFDIHVTNYEQVKKLEPEYGLVLVDESHNLGTRGKPTNRVKDIRALCYGMPAVFLTGTPTIETPLGIYHQWCITKYSPLARFKNFYKFFREYGVPDPVWVNGRSVEQYKKCKDILLPVIEQFAVRVTQEEAGIKHQAKDVVHVVRLEPGTQVMIDNLIKDGVTAGLNGVFVFDTDIGIRTAVHQVEAGALLYEEQLVMLPNMEVVDYLMETFGDSDDVAYFTHFRSTREKLRRHFKHAQLFSSVADAEGVDMSHMRHMVIVNTGYSGAKCAQVRERVVNMNRTTEALVHYVVTDGGISRDVYQMTSRKVDYNLRQFRKKRGA